VPVFARMLIQPPFIFGGAKPVPVTYHRLRHPLRDMMLVALAGPVSNFLLAIVFGWRSTSSRYCTFGERPKAGDLSCSRW
jgi:Zn-dependent protease